MPDDIFNVNAIKAWLSHYTYIWAIIHISHHFYLQSYLSTIMLINNHAYLPSFSSSIRIQRFKNCSLSFPVLFATFELFSLLYGRETPSSITKVTKQSSALLYHRSEGTVKHKFYIFQIFLFIFYLLITLKHPTWFII